MRGKKVAITSDHVERIVQALRVGATYERAAQYAGISEDTLSRWRKRAEHATPDSLLGQLRDRMRQAEGRAAVGWLAIINTAAQVDWKAASWLLSHRYPEAYGSSLHKVAPVTPDGEALQGGGLSVLLHQAIIALPSKSPSPEQWAEDVAALRERAHGAVNGAQGHRREA